MRYGENKAVEDQIDFPLEVENLPWKNGMKSLNPDTRISRGLDEKRSATVQTGDDLRTQGEPGEFTDNGKSAKPEIHLSPPPDYFRTLTAACSTRAMKTGFPMMYRLKSLRGSWIKR
jgi:hypothetical protein